MRQVGSAERMALFRYPLARAARRRPSCPCVQALRAAAKDWVDVQLHGEITITMNLSESVQIFL